VIDYSVRYLNTRLDRLPIEEASPARRTMLPLLADLYSAQTALRRSLVLVIDELQRVSISYCIGVVTATGIHNYRSEVVYRKNIRTRKELECNTCAHWAKR